jgi:hypothetical protein
MTVSQERMQRLAAPYCLEAVITRGTWLPNIELTEWTCQKIRSPPCTLIGKTCYVERNFISARQKPAWRDQDCYQLWHLSRATLLHKVRTNWKQGGMAPRQIGHPFLLWKPRMGVPCPIGRWWFEASGKAGQQRKHVLPTSKASTAYSKVQHMRRDSEACRIRTTFPADNMTVGSVSHSDGRSRPVLKQKFQPSHDFPVTMGSGARRGISQRQRWRKAKGRNCSPWVSNEENGDGRLWLTRMIAGWPSTRSDVRLPCGGCDANPGATIHGCFPSMMEGLILTMVKQSHQPSRCKATPSVANL